MNTSVISFSAAFPFMPSFMLPTAGASFEYTTSKSDVTVSPYLALSTYFEPSAPSGSSTASEYLPVFASATGLPMSLSPTYTPISLPFGPVPLTFIFKLFVVLGAERLRTSAVNLTEWIGSILSFLFSMKLRSASISNVPA